MASKTKTSGGALQISIYLPLRIIRKAESVAKKGSRADGLRLTPSAVLRDWTIKGMEAKRNGER